MKRLFPVVCVFLLFVAANSFGGSATWNLSPTSGDWNTAPNWTPETVPNSETDVATFGQSNVTNISVPSIQVDRVIFGADASPYTFTVYNAVDVAYLIFWGAGVINNSPNEQTFIDLTSPFSSSIQFRNSATAGDRVTYYSSAGGNAIFFFDSSSAGSATFIVTSSLVFYEGGATAANATIINDGGYTSFSFDATAENAVITNQRGGHTDLCGSRAANATITNEGAATADELPGHTTFCGDGFGNTATIINNPATVQRGQGGYTYYSTSAPADSPTIINNGSSLPGGRTAAMTVIGVGGGGGSATLIAHGGVNGGAGGRIVVEDKVADGGMARVQLDGNGYFDISLRIRSAVNIGSIEGNGKIFLGANTLAIGTNNLSTQFSGHIQDGNRHNRTGGSITKIGSGTLTLAGANTYTGGTTVNAGVLRVNNTKGSATGTGDLKVDAGTLGGKGIIAGAVTVGTGTGSGAFIAPSGAASQPATLTVTSTVTFKADSTYTYKLNTEKAKADQLIANGISIESGAQFDLTAVANGKLTVGTVFIAISNTSATAISGTFANLPDGGTIIAGPNTLQASYEGGDGNDLTLTVQ